jgi:segregation and condensation protein B
VFEEALEAILFAAGHPISYATLARVFDMTPGAVKDKVFEYSLKYNDPDIPRGVMLLTYGDSCQLCTKQYYLTEIRDALGIKKSGSLSTSSMEALAIIAYNQPVTRVFVDTLRRVDSSYAMNNLLDRGLIESKGRMDAPGRPMLYGTTKDFLRCFGLKDLSGLPKTSDELMEVFDKAKLAEAAPEEGEAEAAEENNQDSVMEAQIEIELEEPSADDDIVTDI